MKKSVLAVVLLCVLSLCFPGFVPAKADVEDNSPSRLINLVYDDSSSMIENYGPVDTWCQAKYSMEVFAALLGKKDVMNVYSMFDFRFDDSSGPALTLLGSDGAETNVSKIHNMLTNAGPTPFTPVKKAYEDLLKASADEKWLVVLTDGVFRDADDETMNAFFDSKDSSVKVLFLSMGKGAPLINSNSQKNIFCEKAETSNQILNKLTTICTRIFNSNKLNVDVASGSFEFDVPMSELIVFAQGANVSIKGLVDESGNLIKSSGNPVSVKYSDKAFSENVQKEYVDTGKIIIAKDLNGCVLNFNGNFDPGKYKVDADGAETIEVYYKPNVEIAAYIIDSSGNEVSDMSSLKSGDYTLKFGFVKPGTGEPVPESKLLGEISYEATVTNNGNRHDKIYNNGDTISLEDGSLSIDAVARYLDYNTITTHIDYDVYSDRDISFELLESNDVNLIAREFPNPGECKTVIKATIDGMDFTADQWAQMGLPLVTATDFGNMRIGTPLIEKTSEPGVYAITPQFTKSKPRNRNYELTQDYSINFEEKVGPELWSGTTNGSLKFVDSRSFIERYLELIIFLIILAVILLILIGYIPGIKHYLPKSLRKRPNISITGKNDEAGRMKKHISCYLPYLSQRASIRFLPTYVSASPKSINVEALKDNSFKIKNIESFKDKDCFKVNSVVLKTNEMIKDYEIANSDLTIEYIPDKKRRYTCYFSTPYRRQ